MCVRETQADEERQDRQTRRSHDSREPEGRAPTRGAQTAVKLLRDRAGGQPAEGAECFEGGEEGEGLDLMAHGPTGNERCNEEVAAIRY